MNRVTLPRIVPVATWACSGVAVSSAETTTAMLASPFEFIGSSLSIGGVINSRIYPDWAPPVVHGRTDDKEVKNLGVTAMSVVPFATSSGSDPAAAPTDAADARQQMLAVKRTLDEASAAVESLQGALAAQHELEQLLKQGRTHLQDLRARLQHAEEERERFVPSSSRAAPRISATSSNCSGSSTNRRPPTRSSQRSAPRATQRSTFTRLLNEAESKEREMIQERDALRQQIEALRDAGMRAQSLAREIIQAHEHGDFSPARPSE